MGPEKFIREMPVWILRKEAEEEEAKLFWASRTTRWNKKLIPFAYNRMQHEIEQNLGRNNIILKYRQGGTTTWAIIRRLFLAAILEPGTSSLLISQTKAYGVKHFEILKRAFRYFAEQDPFDRSQNGAADSLKQHLLHVQYSPRHELVFDQLDSRILVDTAENEEVGQGLPGVNHLVATEIARWPRSPEETMANVSESVSPNGTRDLESTANQMGGYFFEEYMRAKERKSVYKAHFYAWPYAEEYTLRKPKQRGRYISTFQDMTEEERAVKDLFQLTLGQVAWRRKKIITLRHNFYEKYPENDTTCFLVSGNQFFDKVSLRERLYYVKAHVRPLIEYQTAGPGGYYRIWQRPIKGRPYILYADVAMGMEVSNQDTDWSYFTVVDQATGEQVAAYRTKLPPEDFAYHVYNAATHYYGALVGVERNPGGGGYSVIITLRDRLGYGNIYEHEEYDQTSGKLSKKHKGLPMTSVTRPIALNFFAEAIRMRAYLVNDMTMLEECLTFVHNAKKRGRPEAAEGCHDDAVMAAAGAEYIRQLQLGWSPTGVKETYNHQAEEEEVA